MPPDSGEIDKALVARLQTDAALMALMPDGVFFDVAGPSMVTGKNSTQFVLLSIFNHADRPVFGGRAFETVMYAVRAVALTGDVKSAAARIDALLEDYSLVVPGFTPMTVHRESRMRLVEVDEHDASIRWNHRGGRYLVQMSLG